MPPVDVVGFGMLTPATVIIVDEFPRHNTGAHAKAVVEFICDDAALIAALLRDWNVNSGLIGTALGADVAGKKVADQLQALGVVGPIRLFSHLTTPFEFYFADPTGARTFAWKRDPEVLATLATADLSLLTEASLLYVDW